MATETRDLLPGEYTVLGLLRREPLHGYELARCARDEGLTAVLPLEQSALYAYLNNLEERKLVSWREERAGRRPPRKRYELTPQGAATVARWLREPVMRMREIRLEFLVKLYLLGDVSPGEVPPLLERQLDVCRAYLEDISGRVPGSEGMERLIALSKESAARATVDWLEQHLTETKREPAAGVPESSAHG